MRERKLKSTAVVLATFICISYGCEIENYPQWGIPMPSTILDITEIGEIVISLGTTDIEAVSSISYGQATLAGPYFDLSIEDSQLVVRTNADFPRYEEVEVESRVVLTVGFNCTGGGTRGSLILWVDVNDTNNNEPVFLPSNEFEFVVTPPLPPNFLVTGCNNDVITVRDIDLTTYGINFTIEDNPYFEIEYDTAASDAVDKQFVAQLRTKTLIRSFNEITLNIAATDVDRTNDPPLTTYGVVRIVADSEFQFPEEPVFTQTFYLANYTDDHQLNLLETISLRQGFDEYVNFTLEGAYYENFELRPDGNQVSIIVIEPIPNEFWSERQSLLVVKADREYTSGASATVIIQFPEEIELRFERAFYEGVIINNILRMEPLVLSQGYEGSVSAEIIGEHSSHFTATVQSDLVTLTMTPLMDDVLDNNSFISLQVMATSGSSSATTVVNLEIIKDDNNTPVFDKFVYSGSYDTATGLTIDQIYFVQGFDNTVTVDLIGEHASYFEIVEIGPVMTISSTIPPEMFSQGNILITIEASKPRTVGANAAVNVALPVARALEFEESSYRGSLEDGLLTLQTILLSQGYEEGVSFNLSGELSMYFNVTHEEDLVTIALQDPLLDTDIAQNSVILLTLTASGLNAITTTTTVLLDVIKEDTTTPVFTQHIYYGTYSNGAVEIEPIILSQGLDSTVSFRIDGADAQYFAISDNAVITLELPIPEDVIFSEKVLLFNVLADKALTVGANAAVLIRFPAELTESAIMRFSRHTYVGTLEENELNLEEIVLDTGFAPGTEFILSGDYSDHFSWTSSENILQISALSSRPEGVLEENNVIVLEVEARRARAVSVWTSVVVDIVKKEVIAPVFGQAYYTGVYTEETGLTFEETINLSEGYDSTVTFELSGEPEEWFSIEQDGESLTLVSRVPVPIEILESNNQLLFTIIANKPNAISGRSVISLDLPKDFSDSSFRFQQDFYKGYLENDTLLLNDIILGDFTSYVNYTFTGDYTEFFQLINQNGTFTIQIEPPLPNEILEETKIFTFVLEAHNTIMRTHTVIIIENVRMNQAVEAIEFEEPYYIGSYSATDNLQFDSEIKITAESDQTVMFDLEGEHSVWFGLVPNGNSVTLTLTSQIPAFVIENNQKLVFVVTALSSSNATARATIVITLTDFFPEESTILAFDRVTYLGSIENNQLNVSAITLREGYAPGVEFILHGGELQNYFRLSPDEAVVTVTLQDDIPEHLIPANRIIVLEIQATAPQAITAYATIVIEYIVDDDISPVVELVFAQTFYRGSYAATTGLSFPTPISLTQGYDSNVEFALEGDDAEWFSLVPNGNSVTVILTSPIPPGVIASNQQLVFVVTAQSPDSATARATVTITLVDAFPEGSSVLGFDRVTYLGSIENNQLNVSAITLREGYAPGVEFILHGELQNYFRLSPDEAVVTVTLQDDIPEHLIPANRIIVLEIQATAPQAITAYATIVIEYIVDDDISPVVELVFAQTFYRGSYAAATGLSFPTPISLTQGYDSNVEFALEGDDAEWFSLVPNGNSVTVILTSPIPPGVIASNQQLVFVVTAQSPHSATARATVTITLVDAFPEGSSVLGFDRVTYLGSIENNQLNISAITLREGYAPGVEFILHGELQNYFRISPDEAVVTVTLQDDIPEHLIPANRITVLEIQATAPQAITAYATIVIEYIVDDDISPVVELVFAQTFYRGSYAAATGLSFPTPISLTQGYDSNVEFALEGDDAEWFSLVPNGNSVTVILTSPIPPGVIASNQQLVFVVTAQSPDSATARATVTITLVDAFPEGSSVLGFDRVTYLGSIENNQLNVSAITLREGYAPGVEFILHGELQNYFRLSPDEAVVTVTLQDDIPEHLIPANRIIVLEIQATAPQAITAYATIVIEYIVDDDISPVVELVFAQTFYRGSYAAATGLSFPTPISLTQGYDSNVEFALEGDDAEWFSLVPNGNSVTVILTSPIPPGVIASNQQLVFVVTAQSPDSATARATVTITLVDAFPEGSSVLGFDRVTYLGSIENNQLNVSAITLREGYAPGVEFILHGGELQNYFRLSPDEAVVTVTLQDDIPEHLIPANRIIVLEIQATAPQAITAYATIVIEYIVDDDISPVVELVFAQTFYRGSYAATTGLSFPTPISLTQGYDSNVEFALEGDDAEWFSLVPNGNSVTVILTSPIPPGVIASNQQLVFVVTAQSPDSATARATVTITLVDAFPEGSSVLGFDRVTYLGSIENNQLNISAITLREGYAPGVEFILHGELQNYFRLSPDEAVVTVTLQDDIPEHLIPANRIIVLEIQATAPQAITAYATIVIEYIVDDDISPVVELVFAQTFYRGSYAATTGLSFPTPISLTQGYDSNVEFALEGDDAEWFSLVPNGNSVTVILTSPIPPGVIASNQQLVFVVTAQSPDSATARATVTITLVDAFPEGSSVLGFDRVTYLGTIENNQLNVSAITLREGYAPGVEFILHGELQNYFRLSPDEAVVTVTLQDDIPEHLIPANRIIVLEIQATAPQAITAYATIVIEYIVDDDISPVVELVFAQTFYRGSYAAATGLSFPTPISLTQGYDSNVEFALEGDDAEWFSLVPNGNSVTVILTSPIPPGVIASNQQLVFVVTAQSSSSPTARAVIIISLNDDLQPGLDVSFVKVLYEGIVQNNVVYHETITVIGFSGSTIELHGEYSSSFVAVLSNDIVTVSTSSSFTLPSDVNHAALELRAGSASAVLVLNVIHTDGPTTPTVSFSSPSYAIRVDISQTGLVGQVQATADNGEAVTYSLQLANAHLEERLSINGDGELHLAAPVNTGFYTFEVVATTLFTQTQGTAVVHLSVETATVCGNDLVMPPLIILDVDEEESHYDLINGTQYDGCHFTLTSRWPLDQAWVYVDEGGLHTTAIDREHESIAFMAVSQVQVEVILHCEADSTRIKRSVASDALGPYDYGSNKWILTDTILFNSRRSLVNIIVNDINDNAPIFVDKENEPIAVGYPVPELAERVLPRSLAELQATDADIGENAALLYWSSAEQLAVAPATGFVHLRDGATLENGVRLTVNATDRYGEGLTGSIDIMVRLLDESYIAVVTVRDAFLDDEKTVLSTLSEAIGYEIKALRSVVISNEIETEVSRKKRDVTSAAGASLQLYVYGLIAREPVSVEQLTTDINNIVTATVTVASSVSLEDHLEGQEICVIAGRDTGLLVATIVLSVLLFIVLVLIAVWFFLRWRKNRNYDQFSDQNSLESRNASEDPLPKPEVLPKPRLDIAELKRSERRLQEMLDAPVDEISVEPTSSRNDAVLTMPVQNPTSFRNDPFPKMPEPMTPIVIQSIDKLKDAADESTDDEFGEVKTPRRKSVVTFNENVEKIIHVEEPSTPDTEDGEPDYEVYKL